MMFADKISRQLSIDCAVWRFVVILMQIYNEKEQAEQGKIQNVQFEEKKITQKFNEAKCPMLKRDTTFKEKS